MDNSTNNSTDHLKCAFIDDNTNYNTNTKDIYTTDIYTTDIYTTDDDIESNLSSIIIQKYKYINIIKYLLLISLILFIIFIVLYNCLYSDYYYYVYTNTTLPNGINITNLDCSFKYENKYYDCKLKYNTTTQITYINIKNNHFHNIYYNNFYGELYIEYNNNNYNQLLKGFKENQIFNKYFKRCDINSPSI